MQARSRVDTILTYCRFFYPFFGSFFGEALGSFYAVAETVLYIF